MKLTLYLSDIDLANVAPYIGAWIEIQNSWYVDWCSSVAPYIGAWIEITLITYKKMNK
ncbi:hypothetical protein P9Z39_29090 [Bacillus thuringiensis]|uniref:hypothetical protein n=1 Tax=Bacillus thuringiensis TaxID=1428 RepID=UPI002DB896D2|nr:hypothetical protein [Bacillus thuringiensis]MEC2709669.1 hypothetical protein [Bacillus thuringiensis]